MSTKVKHYRTCVANVNYHFVFVVKYRRKVLDASLATKLKTTLNDIANDKGFTIKAIEIGEQDHVHLFVTAHPKLSIGQIVKWLKGISGRVLLYRNKGLAEKLYRGHLWSNTYYVETIGSTSEENIRRYIENQNSRG
jgi:transposase